METCTDVLSDWRPGFRKYKSYITLGFCVVCYLLGLAHVTQVTSSKVTNLPSWRHCYFAILSSACFVPLLFGNNSKCFNKTFAFYLNLIIFAGLIGMSQRCFIKIKPYIIEKFTAWRVNSTLNFTRETDIARIAKRWVRYRFFKWNLTWNSLVRQWIFLESHS